MSKYEKIILWIVKIGLFLIPILPLYISTSMLFPFITGKNFAFRVIIEIIFAFWIGLAFLREEYRPKLTPLFKAATFFILIIFIADLLGLNPYRSFFSNFERMEGFMMLFHLYLYFVMLSSVFARRDWLIFFHVMLSASMIVSFIALLQKLGFRVSMQGGFRVDSTIGNPTYLAAYLIFNLWLILILMQYFWKKWWLEIIYAAILIFELAILYFTATRGAILALFATLFIFAAALVFFWNKIFKQTRQWPQERKLSGLVLSVVIVLPIVFWSIRGSDFVQSSQALRRLTNYSFEEDTIKARFKIWKMSARGFLEHPILGWGQENYYLVFQKYYEPALHGQEPWFDRSHNIIFDWLIHAGILGLGSYLSIIGITFWGLYQGIRKNLIMPWQGLVLMAIFISHFLQNLFVFDNLNTYLLFFGFLAYSGYLISGKGIGQDVEIAAMKEVNVEEDQDTRLSKKQFIGSLSIISALMLVLIFAGTQLHLKPIFQSQALIHALQLSQTQGIKMDQLIAVFKNALDYDSFGNTEIREQIVNMAYSVSASEAFTEEVKKAFIDFAIEEMKKEVDKPSADVKHFLFYGAILNRSTQYGQDYIFQARQALEQANKLSPTKQMVAFELAQHYINTGDINLAVEVLKNAWEGDKSIAEATINLWITAILADKKDVIAEIMAFTDLRKLKETDLYRIAETYRQVKDYDSSLFIYETMVNSVASRPQYHATFAALLANAGRIEDAKKHVQRAVELDPSFAAEAKAFLDSLK